MGREVIADKGIWTAKKRYILNVHDNEGVRLEHLNSNSWVLKLQSHQHHYGSDEDLEKGLEIVMRGTEQELWDFVETSRKEFRELPVEDVASPRGCKGLIQYADSTHIYSKGNTHSCSWVFTLQS